MGATLKGGAFGLGILAGGLATWFQPYNQILLWGMDYRLVMATVSLILAFLYRLFSGAGTLTTGLWLGSGVIVALLARIVFDIIQDPTDHDLWQMEIALFALVAFPSAFIGAYLAELLNWSKAREKRS